MKSVLWRRLDQPGQEACRIAQTSGGWEMRGAVAMSEGGVPGALSYRALFDPDWRALGCEVSGWQEGREIALTLDRDPEGRWRRDGTLLSTGAERPDLDLGLSPCTNLSTIRRLGLAEGEMQVLDVLWLDIDDWQVKPLRQSYHRSGALSYVYGSPDHGFTAELTLDAEGMLRQYGELWAAVDL